MALYGRSQNKLILPLSFAIDARCCISPGTNIHLTYACHKHLDIVNYNATVLAQTENRSKTTNVVSNSTQRRFIATRFPEKIDDLPKMLHLLSSFKPMFFRTKSKKTHQNKYLPRFYNLFSLKFPQLHHSLSLTWGRYTARKALVRESFSLFR